METISAVASMAAVFAALAAQQSTEKLSNAALRPHLDITQRIKPSLGIRIDNAGQGAAIIDEFEIYVDGQPVKELIGRNPYRSSLVQIGLAELDSDGNVIGDSLISTIDPGIAIKAGSSIYVFEWEKYSMPLREMQEKLARISIRIGYHSLSGENYCLLYQGRELPIYIRDNDRCKITNLTLQ